MKERIQTIGDVVDFGLCIGCGVCFAGCDKGGVRLYHVESQGVRPRFDKAFCGDCAGCLDICPGYSLDVSNVPYGLPKQTAGDHEFGPTLEIWEGHAADEAVRYGASSGGILSALALFALEQRGADGVIQTAMDPGAPWRNQTVVSRDRDSVLASAGSRYAPSSPCEALRGLECKEETFIFIGRPCDAAGLRMLESKEPGLSERIGLSLSFFCAGTPSSQGTRDLVRSLGMDPGKTQNIRYRGNGWPGDFEVQSVEGEGKQISYEESWGFLTHHRPFRCNLCPDGLGRFADLTCGDAWHRRGDADSAAGRSLVLVRTERGREFLRAAMAAGYVYLEASDQQSVLDAQGSLLERRRELHGRLLAMAWMGAAVPRFRGFSLRRSWNEKPLWRRARIMASTARRIWRRKLWRRQEIGWEEPGACVANDGRVCERAKQGGQP